MSTETKFLKLHKWVLPGDAKQNFNYKKAIADDYDAIDEFAENTDNRVSTLETDIPNKLQQQEQKHKKEIEELENLVPTRTSTRRRNYIKR